MKMIFGLLIGLVVGGLLVAGPLTPSVTEASSDQFDLRNLLPDIRTIYREALVAPFQEVEREIEDEDIARFYHNLLQKTHLDKP